MNLPDTMRARYRGALLGLAVGDALGTTLEFDAPGSFEPIHDMLGGGPFGLEPGQWTDDTSMALCLAESLVESGGFDAHDQMSRYVRWWRTGHLSSTDRCFDIGIATREALARFEATGDPYAGLTDPGKAGNGSIMRLAPVPLFFAQTPELAIEMSADSSRTTHAARSTVDGCRYLGALIVGAVRGESKETLLSPQYPPADGLDLDREIGEVAAGSFLHHDPPEIKGSGHVVRSLEAALWALHRHDTFRDGVLTAVNLGDDADTTGAVYGQLAGALYGEEAIPAEWRARLARRELIEDLADRLYERAWS